MFEWRRGVWIQLTGLRCTNSRSWTRLRNKLLEEVGGLAFFKTDLASAFLLNEGKLHRRSRKCDDVFIEREQRNAQLVICTPLRLCWIEVICGHRLLRRVRLYSARLRAMRVCSIEGCEKKESARGWCSMHYWRWKEHGDPNYKKVLPRLCSIEGCEKSRDRREWCTHHYTQWWKYGDPLYNGREKQMACKIDGCDEPRWKAGAGTLVLCKAHYKEYKAILW